MPTYKVGPRNRNRIHGFDFAYKGQGELPTLCGFSSEMIRTEKRGMNCPKCWDEWKRRKQVAA